VDEQPRVDARERLGQREAPERTLALPAVEPRALGRVAERQHRARKQVVLDRHPDAKARPGVDGVR